MAMAVQQGSRQKHDGVKVKFIETQFISSDAASFKAVVQRLTGKSPSTPASSHPHQHAPAPAQPQRPRPCRPAFSGADAAPPQQQHAGWAQHDQAASHGHHFAMPAPKQEPQQRLEELYELCDFGDLLYATAAGSRRDGFPY